MTFDDTIHDKDNVPKGYRMGLPAAGAITALNRLAGAGHKIVIFTARNVQDPRQKKAIEDWMQHFGIPYHGITNIKQMDFDLIIDNRNIHYDTWPQVLARITRITQSNKSFYTYIDETRKI